MVDLGVEEREPPRLDVSSAVLRAWSPSPWGSGVVLVPLAVGVVAVAATAPVIHPQRVTAHPNAATGADEPICDT